MINRKDLMINDLLQIEDGRIGKYNGEFRHCTDYYRICVMSIHNDTDGLLVPESRVYPIQLTEEILLKIGFEEYNADFLNLTIRWNSGIFYDRKCKTFDYKHLELGRAKTDFIANVHQFQHFLRLCRLDELADNLKI